MPVGTASETNVYTQKIESATAAKNRVALLAMDSPDTSTIRSSPFAGQYGQDLLHDLRDRVLVPHVPPGRL